ncbi:Putative teichuronic acid biosynthesis glycosyltransferase tuaH [Modestobacter italicus]|uniref:Teichuronic acid biosynthesis glycosyltransferase tuaH n=1 Tax=Modestobacter italicus (strain DSM 44449 / CECT 9708 / BC 501) TaxID=2732864 RepID=I4ER91_MODI5|nr:glycosyltransferase [Modestobacter marinus]CCH85904.1 Putative teichuronic acid biosynthesis glycosyltransferase tuaH [Modestobacter marinus]
MTDVVVALVSDTWTDAVRRGFYSTADQTLQTLLTAEQVGTVLVADHPRGVASQVRRRLQGDRPAPRRPGMRGVRPLSLVTPPPVSVLALGRRYRAYDLQTAVAARRHGLQRPALVTFNLWHAALADSRWAGQRVFYAQDDESAIPAHAAHRDQTLAAYERIARSGMAVVAVSQVLLDRIAPVGPGLVVPNGVDAELWSVPPPAPVRRPRPVAFYAGTVDARLDLGAFRALAEGGFAVRVAGPMVDPVVKAELAAVPGLELLGSRPRAEVVQLAQSSDVCVLAHHRSPLTEAMSPLKLFEYLASGTPVVATRLPGSAVAGDRVVWVEPGGDHLAGARQALALGRQPEAERQACIREMSWRARHRPLLELIGGGW